MTLKHFTFLVVFLSSFNALLASNGPAMIKDADGFTNVRSGPGIEHAVIDTLYNDDFFYFEVINGSDWAKITAWNGRQIEGYIHQSRIQEVEHLDDKTQKELISKILDERSVLVTMARVAWLEKDSLAYTLAYGLAGDQSDGKYDPILDVIPPYFCSTKDMEIIAKFMVTLCADRSSANELPAFSIGQCFMCDPDLVLEQLSEIEDSEHRGSILDHIEWGLMFHFGLDVDEGSDNLEFNALMEKITLEREKN